MKIIKNKENITLLTKTMTHSVYLDKTIKKAIEKFHSLILKIYDRLYIHKVFIAKELKKTDSTYIEEVKCDMEDLLKKWQNNVGKKFEHYFDKDKIGLKEIIGLKGFLGDLIDRTVKNFSEEKNISFDEAFEKLRSTSNLYFNDCIMEIKYIEEFESIFEKLNQKNEDLKRSKAKLSYMVKNMDMSKGEYDLLLDEILKSFSKTEEKKRMEEVNNLSSSDKIRLTKNIKGKLAEKLADETDEDEKEKLKIKIEKLENYHISKSLFGSELEF